MSLHKLIEQQSNRFETALDRAIQNLLNLVNKWQDELFENLSNDLILAFSTEGGNILAITENLQIAASLKDVFDTYIQNRVLKDGVLVSQDILDLTNKVQDYFTAIGFDTNKTDAFFKDALTFLRERLGIDENGKILRGGALYDVFQSEAVVQKLKNTAIQAVVNGVSLKAYRNELKAIATNENGELMKYYKQISFDYFNQASEIVNSRVAEGLGLEYFIYQGSLKTTSRAFCIKRANKVFSIKEAQLWKNDKDLIVRDRVNYNSLLQRGGYNCRHFIKYISKDMAKVLEPSKFLNE